jgi:hypothetical protein
MSNDDLAGSDLMGADLSGVNFSEEDDDRSGPIFSGSSYGSLTGGGFSSSF